MKRCVIHGCWALSVLVCVFLAPFARAEEPVKDQVKAADVQASPAEVKPVEAVEAKAEPAPVQPAGLATPFTIKFNNGVSLSLYGKLEMLTYWDNTSPYVSDWYFYVLPKSQYEGDQSSFNMSVRGSQLGFKFNYPKALWGGDINAKLEMDFVGGFVTGSMAAYSPIMRLRHAYVSWDQAHYSVLLGQTVCPFMPLFPDTGTWIALGTSGNPWMRLPQIRFTTNQGPVEATLAVARPMAANAVITDSANDIISDGEQSGAPFVMGRLGYNAAIASTGVSATYGSEKVHRQDATLGINVGERLNSWMVGYDLKITTKYVDFKGEAFTGENLNSFFGGVTQGVNTSTTDAWVIRTYGGWGQFTFKPTTKFSVNVGGGIDNPKDSNLTAAQRAYNTTIFANANYKLTSFWTVSLEPVYMRTGYVGGPANWNMRGMFRTTLVF